MALTAVETRTEIQRLWKHADGIESKYPVGDSYPQGLTPEVNADDFNEVRKTLAQIDQHESMLTGLEDAERRRARIDAGMKQYARPAERPQQLQREFAEGKTLSPGTQFINDPEYRRLLAAGAFSSNLQEVKFAAPMRQGTSLVEWGSLRTKTMGDLEQKALLYAGGVGTATTGGLVVPDIRPGVLDILQRELTFLDVVPRYPTQSDTIEYVREDTFTNNAAFVAEASASTGTSGTKPESVLAYSTQTQPVQTLAHYIPITNRLLADAPAIRGIIDQRLLLGLALILESQMLTGNGSGANFRGILNTSNILTQGLTGSNNVLDAIFLARQQVRVTGHARPNVVVLHPNDFSSVRLLREGTATGTYLMGPPSQAGATTLWGLPVIESEAITENTGLVADMVQGAGLFDREEAAIRVGLVNDQFIRNLQTILAELRASWVVFRPSAFCQITGI